MALASGFFRFRIVTKGATDGLEVDWKSVVQINFNTNSSLEQSTSTA
jgi:hypothetical protein